MLQKVNVVWFQKDLRTLDQPALWEAARDDAMVIALVAWEREWNGTLGMDFPKVGSFRRHFWSECIQDLSKELGKLGIPLIIGSNGIVDLLHHMKTVLDEVQMSFYAQHFPGVEEEFLDKKVDKTVQSFGWNSQWFQSFTLIETGRMPINERTLPSVFTDFRKMVEKDLYIETIWPVPELRSSDTRKLAMRYAAMVWQTLSHQSLNEALDSIAPLNTTRSTIFHGGQSTGLKQIIAYTKEKGGLRTYKETRNGLLDWADSSKLSPWLAFGCISARMIYYAVREHEQRYGANESTYWLFFELLWRDYFQLILQREKSKLFRREGIQNLDLHWNQDETYWQAWIEGRTGVPIVDAAMRELKASGWQSNRARQIAACYLVKYLNVDWRIGASWYESQLIDADVGSNYGNWAYIAGIGNDPRGFRVFQMQKQAEQYDAKGEYVRKWLPELANVPNQWVHSPHKMSYDEQISYGIRIGVDYPQPLVDAPNELAKQAQMYQQAKKNRNKDGKRQSFTRDEKEERRKRWRG